MRLGSKGLPYLKSARRKEAKEQEKAVGFPRWAAGSASGLHAICCCSGYFVNDPEKGMSSRVPETAGVAMWANQGFSKF